MLTWIKNRYLDLLERHHRRNGTFDQFATDYIVNKRKTTWFFSGLAQGANNVRSDIGTVASPHDMNRAQALAYFKKNFPASANILHIDDRHKIVTFLITR